MLITTFAEAQAALRPYYDYSRTPYTLDAIRGLMQYLGNPQEKLRIVHVAGTSGKTSTTYYVADLLQRSGASVGFSVSPHVDQMNERLQVNGKPLPEAEFCAILDEFMQLISKCEIRPSYFELFTAMAFWEFARRNLDYAVMEVGLGGLLDATNVVERSDKVCVITDIGLDHTEILGDTIDKIAFQKAGIIHDKNEVFMHRQASEVMSVVERVASEHGAKLHVLLANDDAIKTADLPLFQQRNLSLAVAVVNHVNRRDGRDQLGSESIAGAAAIRVPARLERFNVRGKTIIVDGSHNQQKIQALMESVSELYPDQSIAALAGFVQGKEDQRWQGGVEVLLKNVKYLVFTSFHSELDMPKSSVDPQQVAVYCRQRQFKNVAVIPDPHAAFEALFKRPEEVLLVTGSFYLLNHIRPLIMELVQ